MLYLQRQIFYDRIWVQYKLGTFEVLQKKEDNSHFLGPKAPKNVVRRTKKLILRNFLKFKIFFGIFKEKDAFWKHFILKIDDFGFQVRKFFWGGHKAICAPPKFGIGGT